jgi:flavin reductase (DIM6/NTAB) family NADH-FMN oxidoreductase RutF
MPTTDNFRQAWGKFATGVSVITTIAPDGEIHGMTANGIASVSLDPLLVLVCAGHSTASYPLIKSNGRFAISILEQNQQSIAEYYARPTEGKTGDVEVSFTRTRHGSAVVDGSLATMDCEMVDETLAGDHTIFIGRVDGIQINAGMPLIFFEGKFGQLSNGVVGG